MSIPDTMLAIPAISRSLPLQKQPMSGSKENDPEGVAFEYEVIE
jgi:hypothetical protein